MAERQRSTIDARKPHTVWCGASLRYAMAMAEEFVSQLGNVHPQIVEVCREVYAACDAKLGRHPKQVWGWGPNPEHNNSRCIDFMVYGDKAMGDFIASYIWTHRIRLGLLHQIWYQRIISVGRAREGWRSMGDRGSTTANHMDHPHVNFQNLDAYVPPPGGTPKPDDPIDPDPGGDPEKTPTVDPTPAPTTGENRDCWIQRVDKGLIFHYQDGTSEHVPEMNAGRFRGPKKLRSKEKPAPTFDDNDDAATTAPGGKGGVRITAGMITAATKAVGGSLPNNGGTAEEIAASFNAAVDALFPGILTNKKRAACLVGECAQETAGFHYMAEIGGERTDYAPYYGRGYTQLTHKANYLAFGQFLKQRGVITDANMFVNDPELLESKKWAAWPAVWYFARSRKGVPGWNDKSLFEWCDTASDPWHTISKGVNCGNPLAPYLGYGFPQRAAAINAALAVTPEPVPPKTTTTGVIKPVDDYPYKGSHDGYDPQGWAMSQCVSFCGWRVRSRLGIPKFHNWWGGINFGNANTWVAAARHVGVPVYTEPKVNTIAVRMTGGGGAGHVGHVIEVNADGSFDIEDYNGAGDERYAYRPNRLPGSFVYFLDFAAYAAANPGRLDR